MIKVPVPPPLHITEAEAAGLQVGLPTLMAAMGGALNN